MERYHSVQVGDIFKSAKGGRRIMVVGFAGKITVECRAVGKRGLGPAFTAQVWRSVEDGSERLRISGDHKVYRRAGRERDLPAACAPAA